MLDTKIGLFFKQHNTLWGIFIFSCKATRNLCQNVTDIENRTLFSEIFHLCHILADVL